MASEVTARPVWEGLVPVSGTNPSQTAFGDGLFPETGGVVGESGAWWLTMGGTGGQNGVKWGFRVQTRIQPRQAPLEQGRW